MKNVLLLASGLLATFSSFAQSDTAIAYYDKDWQPLPTSTKAAYFSKSWAEQGKWHRKDFYLPENTIQMDAWYADKATTTRDGVFTTYKKNGTVETYAYTENNRNFEIGSPFYGTENGLQIFEWRKKNGKAMIRKVTDNNGNGTQTYYQEDGKTIASEGKLVGYKREGDWIFKDDKNITGVAVTYKAGEIISKTCYDENGKPDMQHSNCDVSIPAEFKGGLDGWRIFLERNLRYPKQA